MFRKQFRVKSNTTMKSSDRRKLLDHLSNRFHNNIDQIICSKNAIHQLKLVHSNGSSTICYTLNDTPIIFEIEGELYPTVYLLWQHQHLIPCLTTWPPVLDRLQGGADLMLPGVITGSAGYPTNISLNGACGVNLASNAAPIAVGKSNMSTLQLQLAGRQGKAIIVLHTLGDFLWALGDKSSPPDLGPPFKLQEEVIHNSNQSAAAANDLERNKHCTTSPTLVEAAPVSEDTVINSVDKMDQHLTECFLRGAKVASKVETFPMISGTFYKKYVLCQAPEHNPIDIKMSSYKKVSEFLQLMAVKGIIEINERSPGVHQIVNIVTSHPELRKVSVEIPENLANQEGGTSYHPPKIEEVYFVTAHVLPLLPGLAKGTPLSATDFRKRVTEYVKKEELQVGNKVKLNPQLSDILKSREEQATWDTIMQGCLQRMTVGYSVQFGDTAAVVKRGPKPVIQLAVQTRAANKKVTLITGLEDFGFNLEKMGKEIQHGLGTSTSIINPEDNAQRVRQLLIQGNQVKFVNSLLVDTYMINPRFIKGMELAVKAKKKK